MTREEELQRLARALMEEVRDMAISDCDRLANGRMRGPSGARWASVVSSMEPQAALVELIPEIVDQTLFRLLHLLDNDGLPLHWQQVDDTIVPIGDIGFGEMAGWFAGGDWPAAYSKERRHDYLAGLDLDL